MLLLEIFRKGGGGDELGRLWARQLSAPIQTVEMLPAVSSPSGRGWRCRMLMVSEGVRDTYTEWITRFEAAKSIKTSRTG